MVEQFKLSGHKGPVTCLEHSSQAKSVNKNKVKQTNEIAPSCLLSGSEDGTTRLWDFRCGNRAALCIISPGNEEVTAVGFHPIIDDVSNLALGRYPFTV